MGKKKAAKKAQAATAAQPVQARYDAAGQGRRLSGWHTPSSGPNTAVQGLQKIRDRARDLARNDWAGASILRTWTTNMVGTGIVPRPRTKSKEQKQRINQLWSDFVRNADADGVLDFYGLQALVVRAWAGSGEAFIRARPRRINDGLEVPVQVQVLEADMCPLLDAVAWPGLPAGHEIRQGVEYNRIGRKTAVWFYRAHPGDQYNTPPGKDDLVRVPIEQVCHVFEPLRPGQVRGVPEMASVITRLRNTADFDDAVLERQKLANLFTMFLVRPLPAGANDPMTMLPRNGMPDEPLASLQPGISHELLPGEDVRFSDPPDAGANYADFMRQQILGVSAGSGVPYELASGDIKDISDRALRVIINEFHRLLEQRQWLYLIPQMCEKVRGWWADFAVLAGKLSAEDALAAKDTAWAPQGWAYVHPVQDVQAKALEVEQGFRSRSSVIGERGYDPEEVDEERAEDKKRAEALGLSASPEDLFAQNAQPGEQDDEQDSQDDDQDSQDDEQDARREDNARAQADLAAKLLDVLWSQKPASKGPTR